MRFLFLYVIFLVLPVILFNIFVMPLLMDMKELYSGAAGVAERAAGL